MSNGNHVIFIHPDGTSPAHFTLARLVDQGPDGRLNWDKMDEARVYLGHMEDQLTGTSNGGAVTHATGVKVYAESFGFEVVRDANGNPIVDANGRVVETDLVALSGKVNQTIMKEAVAAGKATALINSGVIAEPGSGAFVAQVGQDDVPAGAAGFDRFPRAQFAEITRQVVESGIDVILGGGLVNYLPVGTNPPAGASAYATSAAQLDAISTSSSQRPSVNLIERAQALGYTVVYTEAQLQAAVANRNVTKVLGIFANEDTFNDNIRTATGNLSGVEENQIATSTPAYVPSAPTVGEMLKAAQTILERNPKFRNGSLTVLEEEGTDNFGNINNAAGMLEALRRTDEAVGAALDFYNRHPNTLIITAADSDAGGLQIDDVNPGNVGTINTNPTNVTGLPPGFRNPLDGQTGRGTQAFVAETSASGNDYTFGVGWAGTPDFAGAIVTKAHGLNADKLPTTIDNTDIYRAMYETLFPGVNLPDRPVPQAVPAPKATKETGNVIFIHPDGAGPSIYGAARFVSQGPDGRLNYDQFSNTGVYLGHMRDQITGTSNAGAVTHATGVKAPAVSFGLDEFGESVVSRSGKKGMTIMEEAIAAGKSTAVINSGFIAEPGSGAFLAEVINRSDVTGITEQIVESGVNVILGGGEIHYLPQGVVGRYGVAGIRTDGRNLITEAQSKGYTVVYTLEELQKLPAGTTKVLGIFAAEDTYNDTTEERNAALGLGNYGQTFPDGTPTNPPTVAQMLEAALQVVSQDPDGFMVVLEEEGTDNFGNPNNAQGTIEAALRADAAFGVAMDFIRQQDPNTLLITAADSEAGGLQVYQPTPFAPGYPSTPLPTTPALNVNPTNQSTQAVFNPLDGQNGRVPPWTAFPSQPSLDGNMGNFGVAWVGTPDFSGSITAKTYGMNADLLPATVDNTKIYEIMYKTLFGQESLPNFQEGTNDDERFFGTNDNDAIIGFGGNDTLYGNEGNNALFGSAGDDKLYAGSGNDTLDGGEGNNALYGGEGVNTFVAGAGNDTAYGGSRADTFNLGDGNNIIYANEGNNQITTGAGDDLIYAGAGRDVISAGTGNDRVFSGEGADRFILSAGAGAVTITGYNRIDQFSRGAGIGANTALTATIQGQDTLIKAGDDLLATLKWVRTTSITVV